MAQNYVNTANSQTSVSRWTKPTSEAQTSYFSTHAPKLRVYGLVQTAIQVIWAAVSFVACKSLFDEVFSHIPALLWLSDYLSAFALIVLHVLLRTTYQTYWFDKLDDRTETDSSIILPLLIMAALVWLDYEGAKRFFTSQIEPPKHVSAAPLDSTHQAQTARLDVEYQAQKAEIESVFDGKEAAAVSALDAQIKRLERTRPIDEKDAAFIARKLNKLHRQRDDKTAPVEQAKADSIAAVYTSHQNRLARLDARRETLLAKVDSLNANEDARHQSDLASVDGNAWYLSLFFMLIFALLGYASVRINVKSGILPVRQYTDLDQHGSPLHKIWLAISDGGKRQLHRFAVWLHEALTADAKELTDFDGRVIVRGNNQDTKPAPTLNGHAVTLHTEQTDGGTAGK